MKGSNTSMLVFGMYVVVVGCVFLLNPNWMLSLLGYPEAESFIGLGIGGIAICVSLAYFASIRFEFIPFYKISASIKATAFVVFTLAYALDLIELPLFIVGIIDLVSAYWTFSSLIREGKISLNACRFTRSTT